MSNGYCGAFADAIDNQSKATQAGVEALQLYNAAAERAEDDVQTQHAGGDPRRADPRCTGEARRECL